MLAGASTRSGLTVRRSTSPFRKRELVVLGSQARRSRSIGYGAGHCRRRNNGGNALPGVGRCEQMAGARGLLLLGNALLLRAGSRSGLGHPRRGRACIHHGSPQIARQRRPELRRVVRQAGVVARQIGQPVRRRPVAGVVEFGPAGLMLWPKREEQRPADADGSHRAQAQQHLARKPCDRRAARAEAHLDRRPPVAARIVGAVRHDCGLPSVRTIRTFC